VIAFTVERRFEIATLDLVEGCVHRREHAVVLQCALDQQLINLTLRATAVLGQLVDGRLNWRASRGLPKTKSTLSKRSRFFVMRSALPPSTALDSKLPGLDAATTSCSSC
jgi:hypothetical protein